MLLIRSVLLDFSSLIDINVYCIMSPVSLTVEKLL